MPSRHRPMRPLGLSANLTANRPRCLTQAIEFTVLLMAQAVKAGVVCYLAPPRCHSCGSQSSTVAEIRLHAATGTPVSRDGRYYAFVVCAGAERARSPPQRHQLNTR